MKSRNVAFLALSLAALFWSGNFIAGRALRDDIDPYALSAIRWVICLALFLPLVWRELMAHRAVVLREWKLIVAYGVTGLGAFHTFTYEALRNTTAVNALLIIALAPTAIFLASAIIREARPTVIQWAGIGLSFVGAAVLITRGSADVLRSLRFETGDLWMLAAVVVWAVYSILLRRRPPDLPPNTALVASMIVAVIALLPLVALLSPGPLLAYSGQAWAAILYIAVFASLLAYKFWGFGVDRIGPGPAGQFINLMPLFGAVLAVAILGETIAPTQFIGAGFVVAGIALVNLKPAA